MRKPLGIAIALLVMGGVAYVALNQSKAETTIDRDTTVAGDYAVPAGKRLVVRNGATLTVEGDVTVGGSITCADGPVQLVVKGAATIDGTITCDRGASADLDGSLGVTLVVAGSLTLGPAAEISSNGHIQLVERADALAKSPAETNRLFDEAANDSGTGNRVGPFVPQTAEPAKPAAGVWPAPLVIVPAPPQKVSLLAELWGVPAAKAGSHTVVIGGRIRVGTPPPGVRQIVVFSFPTAAAMTLQNFQIEGPDGRDGDADRGNSCTARGKDGSDAFRMLVHAPNITVNNFTVKLGNGGAGGDAETTADCKPGTATGGQGGKPGNFKMIADEKFEITGTFNVFTGNGGAGGSARAYGKDGGPSEDGGDATATGGAGADNVKKLSIAGTVAGTANVTFDSVWGGVGGSAKAQPGKGGDGQGCGKNGGQGGNATATGGQGGKASLTLSGGAGRTPTVDDAGGDGGDATATAAMGGNGGSCGPEGPGGNGGHGGDATAKPGNGGTGTTRNGADGTKTDETGGNGGTGGDGCQPGRGGNGGKGNPPGKKGADGKVTCVKPGTNTSVTPGVNTSVGQDRGSESQSVKVIQYGGKFLPLDQLIIENEAGCGAEHYHAAQGVSVATDGTRVPDPGPQCGYGKVSERPTLTVEVVVPQ